MTTTPEDTTPENTTRDLDHWVRLDGQDHDRTIDTYELFSARRALRLLKSKLGRERLLNLLSDEIAAGDDFLREQIRLSDGQELTGSTTLRARGVDAARFGGWLAKAFDREDVLLAAHPEHYSIHHARGRDVNVVETLGEYVCSFFMRPWNPDAPAAGGGRPASASASVSASAPAGARTSQMLLADGTVVGSISTTFTDTPDEPHGLTAHLSVTLPRTCAALVEQHLEHFAVEFRSWILLAASERTTHP